MTGLVADELGNLGVAHLEALEWFERHAGEVGPRPWGKNRPDDIANAVTLAAQRGIHVPSGWDRALSVTSTQKSNYGEGAPLVQPDGTWLFPYAAHAGGDGFGLDSRWNRGLVACWRTGTPVGVMSEIGPGAYRIWGLAYVEDYDLRVGFFLLHGPVALSDSAVKWEVAEAAARSVERDPAFGTEEDPENEGASRVAIWAMRREKQQVFRAELQAAYSGRCAVTGVGVAEVLQAAHILNYSGPSSQRVSNGILLRADVHLLFDRHLLTVDPSSMRVLLAPSLAASHYRRFEQNPLAIPSSAANRPSTEKLAVHHQVCQRAWRQAG